MFNIRAAIDFLTGWRRTPTDSGAPVHRSSAVNCYGRDELCQAVVASAFNSSCVLLFGGRQAGKTTILRRIEEMLEGDRRHRVRSGHADLAVFIDLMRLPYDATPAAFFNLLAVSAYSACERTIGEFRRPRRRGAVKELVGFEEALTAVRESNRAIDLRFLFLIDESKRILGERFPDAFRDNLFTLLYGSSPVRDVCCVVFAGAQELYRFAEDGTSPIASRAAKHFVVNVTEEIVLTMLREFGLGDDASDAASRVFAATGGHAGLSSFVSRVLAADPERKVEAAIAKVTQERSELFQIWLHSLSPEARIVEQLLLKRRTVSFEESVRSLVDNGRAPYRADRAWDEVQFAGIAGRVGQ
jgi:hypothetical protein